MMSRPLLTLSLGSPPVYIWKRINFHYYSRFFRAGTVLLLLFYRKLKTLDKRRVALTGKTKQSTSESYFEEISRTFPAASLLPPPTVAVIVATAEPDSWVILILEIDPSFARLSQITNNTHVRDVSYRVSLSSVLYYYTAIHYQVITYNVCNI